MIVYEWEVFYICILSLVFFIIEIGCVYRLILQTNVHRRFLLEYVVNACDS